jgi:GxxExxY protein
MELLHKELTEKIIKVFFDVYNELGYGFLEKVYQNALLIELTEQGFHVEAQKQISVYYRGVEVGVYFADLVVDDLVILELKAAECLVKQYEWQLINYLRGTEMEVGLLLNFGKKPEFLRRVFENTRKNL